MVRNLKIRLEKIEEEFNIKASKTFCVGMAYRNLSDNKLYDENGKLWQRPEYGKNCRHFVTLDCPVINLDEIPGCRDKRN
ncbi:hypothetical protein A3F57_03210 [Candidatus Roizmanbacteria bacterium RIFCSPHIGHO2_12_FULL_36_11]|uniref:Uncharacterized protein n=1 Tax=Candidatus Curtissbacteria bacterium RIFCSPLOWO2_01_FULL_37_9 TaxID=1797724 RepID=A0A1F5GUK8_9BACT|nr:MAG: hypothetical protein A3A48_03705 [Candidatus Curtissbacteria bacterium RIFCSPLOWO2_01_FULL_37_9]OGK32571.1 MAG: hypothetical protein A3F57_03210 [Candidatus Roizmanbacteria bacterium RIFCSPHIGHO2_12_FULL_36_11]